MSAAEQVRAIAAPLCAERDLELYDVEHERGTMRVLVDRSGGVDLGTLAEVNKALSRALDEHDPVAGHYTLEVSSPGLERPLRRPEHFEAVLGETVKVKTRPGTEGDRRVNGRLVAADAEGIDVETPAGEHRRISYDDIASARTVFEWTGANHRTEAAP
jgi:ribosome maturation factor RimP